MRSHGCRSREAGDRIGCRIATEKRSRIVFRASGGTIENQAACPALERFAPSKPHDRREDSRSFVDTPDIGRFTTLASPRAFPLLDHSWRPEEYSQTIEWRKESSSFMKRLCPVRSSCSIFHLDIRSSYLKRSLGDQAHLATGFRGPEERHTEVRLLRGAGFHSRGSGERERPGVWPAFSPPCVTLALSGRGIGGMRHPARRARHENERLAAEQTILDEPNLLRRGLARQISLRFARYDEPKLQ